MWDLSFLTKDPTCLPALEAQNLNHETTTEVPDIFLTTNHNITSYLMLIFPGKALDKINNININLSRILGMSLHFAPFYHHHSTNRKVRDDGLAQG